MSLKLYRLRARTTVGETTIEVVNLNDSARLVPARFEVGEIVLEALKRATLLLQDFQSKASAPNRNRLLNQVETLLLECQEDAAYAATSASVLHGDSAYSDLRNRMVEIAVWNDELEALHAKSQELIL